MCGDCFMLVKPNNSVGRPCTILQNIYTQVTLLKTHNLQSKNLSYGIYSQRLLNIHINLDWESDPGHITGLQANQMITGVAVELPRPATGRTQSSTYHPPAVRQSQFVISSNQLHWKVRATFIH